MPLERGGPSCLNRISASISGTSSGVRLPCGVGCDPNDRGDGSKLRDEPINREIFVFGEKLPRTWTTKWGSSKPMLN